MQIIFAIPGFSTDSNSAEGRAVCKVVDWCATRIGSRKYKPGAVVFTIDRAFGRRSSNLVNAAALETLLACLTQLNTIWLHFHPNHVELYQSPVYYKRTLIWDTIPALYARGFGDCKSLTACLVAELRRKGIWCRPVFRHAATVNSTMFHILVMLHDGSWDDPSKVKGMLTYQENPSMSRHMHRATPHGIGFGNG